MFFWTFLHVFSVILWQDIPGVNSAYISTCSVSQASLMIGNENRVICQGMKGRAINSQMALTEIPARRYAALERFVQGLCSHFSHVVSVPTLAVKSASTL